VATSPRGLRGLRVLGHLIGPGFRPARPAVAPSRRDARLSAVSLTRRTSSTARAFEPQCLPAEWSSALYRPCYCGGSPRTAHIGHDCIDRRALATWGAVPLNTDQVSARRCDGPGRRYGRSPDRPGCSTRPGPGRTDRTRGPAAARRHRARPRRRGVQTPGAPICPKGNNAGWRTERRVVLGGQHLVRRPLRRLVLRVGALEPSLHHRPHSPSTSGHPARAVCREDAPPMVSTYYPLC
jgi:hypothetical protein